MSEPANERTEDATPRRRQKETEKGNIPKSQDLNGAFVMTVGVALLAVFSNQILGKIEKILYFSFTELKPSNINTNDILTILLPYVSVCAQILLPFFVLLTVATIFIIRAQTGNIFAPEKIKFDPENLSPSKMLKNAQKILNPFEPRNLVELLKSLAKFVIVFFCGFSAVNGRIDELLGLFGHRVETSFVVIGSILTQMVINICLAMLIIGLIDKKYQDYEFNKSIKMSKQEVKDEFKDTEGDPKVKARVRSVQMKIMRQKMMSSVAKASVVVTNPTHYAVALEYDRLKSPAPKLVAKGVDFVAFKIREIAQNNNVPIVENPPLARALYKLVPIDGIIPSDMFVAVAEVLAYVYNKNKQGGK